MRTLWYNLYLWGSSPSLCVDPLCCTKRCRCWNSALSCLVQCLSCSSISALNSLWLISLSSSITWNLPLSLTASWTSCLSCSTSFWLCCDHTAHISAFMKPHPCHWLHESCACKSLFPASVSFSTKSPPAILSVICILQPIKTNALCDIQNTNYPTLL